MFKILNLKFLPRYLFLVFGCLHLVGGPYSLVQLYAWGNMLVTYSQETSFQQAAEDTFSGEKPCHLCKKISAAKSDESKSGDGKQPLAPANAKLFQDLFPPTIATLSDPFSTPFPCPAFPAVAEMISPPANGPPSPPPRC